ncbi:MAG TPA: rhomboid family intramembrane serine protease, partial [Thermoanaerobaculia bacterium]|nr:rhomboid family intramembrane serine protease [Thermoanaerobaculia bacterium]
MIPLGDSRRPRRLPLATWAIAAACAGTFLWELSLGPGASPALARIAISPAEIVALVDPPRIALRLLAALFLHAGWLHLAGNLAFL